jgi:predicted metalloprotease with PDZ domain
MNRLSLPACFLFAIASVTSSFAQSPIALSVDLRDAPRKIVHAVETIPVTPGPMVLAYPKWIPGEHGPTGPIDNQAGFLLSCNGEPVKWERDQVEMFSYHITIPAGCSNLEAKMDFLATASPQGFSAGASTSANLAVLSWNSVVVYPYVEGMNVANVMVTPALTLPAGWRYGTALQLTGSAPDGVQTFKTVSLEQLIDSPVLSGRYFKEIPLAPEITPAHYLDMAADGPEDLELNDAHLTAFHNLVRQTGYLYKSRHYGSYHFLVTLSDQVAHFGLEHHQSSDDRVEPRTFVDDTLFQIEGDLLPHEFTHSWNGKYRRPAGLATPNYQVPMIGDLLWVYEGLTQYLGDVLAARSGIWTADTYRDYLASSAASLDTRPGRTWRDLQDTTRMAQILYTVGGPYDNWRRATDFYAEGELVWLDVDTTIREKTAGKKSLDDFIAAFHGLNGNTAPKVIPYTFEDVVASLNAVCPYDWAAFLKQRLDSNKPGAPLGGIEHGGYKLVYTDKPNSWTTMLEGQSGTVNFWYSLGLRIAADGTIGDVLIGGLGDKAQLGPGMKIIAINGRAFTPGELRSAVRRAVNATDPLEFIVENTGSYRIVKIAYHGGERYPSFARVSSVPDRIDDIVKPMTK